MNNPALSQPIAFNAFTAKLKEMCGVNSGGVRVKLRFGFADIEYMPAEDGLPEGFRERYNPNNTWRIDGISTNRVSHDMVGLA